MRRFKLLLLPLSAVVAAMVTAMSTTTPPSSLVTKVFMDPPATTSVSYVGSVISASPDKTKYLVNCIPDGDEEKQYCDDLASASLTVEMAPSAYMLSRQNDTLEQQYREKCTLNAGATIACTVTTKESHRASKTDIVMYYPTDWTSTRDLFPYLTVTAGLERLPPATTAAATTTTTAQTGGTAQPSSSASASISHLSGTATGPNPPGGGANTISPTTPGAGAGAAATAGGATKTGGVARVMADLYTAFVIAAILFLVGRAMSA